MTAPSTRQRSRTWVWVAVALAVIVGLGTVTALLTAPRPGGQLDPGSTGPDGTHALVSLLRDEGVRVDVAGTAADAVRLSGPDTLLLVGQTYYLWDDELLDALARASGDLLLVNPSSRTRERLAPELAAASSRPGRTPGATLSLQPDCSLRAAQQAGSIQFSTRQRYRADSDDLDLTVCYDGVLVQYRDGDRTVTVVGSAAFMTNAELAAGGNAALAMNLAGHSPHLVWYAPQHLEAGQPGAKSLTDLMPDRVGWIVAQLVLVVVLLAIWQARRLGPLVAEELPVVVRASETVEGRGRLYRARRSRDRAAQALRTATMQRLAPRLGLGTGGDPAALVTAVAQNITDRHGAADPIALHHTLFGPAPASDADLLHLARALDDIERQVTHS